MRRLVPLRLFFDAFANFQRRKNMIFDFESMDETKKYKIMSNTIFPRPIAWITTQDGDTVNLAPFSYFAPLSSEPPLVVVSIAKKEDSGEPKDTFANILKHGVCTINLAHDELLKQLIDTSEELPKEVSECERFGIKYKNSFAGFPADGGRGKSRFVL